MGMVFRATQTSVQRPVAVKTLNPALAAAPTFFERFRREAEIASRLRHPNVITIYDFGRAAGRHLLLRDGAPGGREPQGARQARRAHVPAPRGGRHRAGRARPRPRARAERRPPRPQAAQHHGAAARRQGLRQGAGLRPGEGAGAGGGGAAHLHRPGARHARSTCRPSRPAASAVDQRSDLYSLSGVLYLLPHRAPRPTAPTRCARRSPPRSRSRCPPVASKRQGAPVPQALDDFFQKALAREKEDRYQTAEEFIEAMLDAVARCPRSSSTRCPPTPRPKRRGVAASPVSAACRARAAPPRAASGRRAVARSLGARLPAPGSAAAPSPPP